MSELSPAPARQRSRRGSGGELRTEVLTAAMALLAETGDEDAMSVRSVAERVGVSGPSIYLHFADKQALLDAVCDRVFCDLDAAMQAAAAGAPNPFEALRRQGVAYVEFAVANPEHYRVVMMRRHAASDASADAYADLEMASAAFAHLVASVTACVQTGVLVGEPVSLALQLWAAAHGLASLLVAKPYFPWPELGPLVDQTICMAGLGLAAQARLGEDWREQPLADLITRLDRLGS